MKKTIKIARVLFSEKDMAIVAEYNLSSNHVCIYSASKNVRRLTRAKENPKSQAIIKRLKINGCAICGYTKCNSALSFHHTNPKDKKFLLTVGSLLHKNEKVSEEVNKCILLCCRCHREIHEKERLNAAT